MAQDITKIIRIDAGNSERTIKGLKEEIKGLRDALLNVEKGSEDYKKIVDQLIQDEKDLTGAMRAGKDEVSAATGSYNALANEMSSLKKVWKEVTDEATRNELGARINELNGQLKEMDASTGNFQRNVGNYLGAVTGLTEAYKSQKQELQQLKQALEQLEPGTAAYNQAFMRAAEISHNLTEQQEALKLASRDLGTQLGNIRGIAQGMLGGISALNAAMGLMGKDTEDVQKAMLKTQQAMAIVQGLQGMEGLIKRTKGLSAALMGTTKALKTTTVAQKGLNTAMKANPIGLLVTALAGLIVYWKEIWSWLTKLIGGTEKMNELIDNAKARVMGLANAIGSYLLMPLKTAIASFKVLGNVVADVFSGNWGKIKQDVKEGIDDIKGEVEKGFSFMKNYEEAYNEQSEKNAKKRAEQRIIAEQEANKKSAELREKELNDYIKDTEARIGQDWKWTEEGKKAYEELYKTRMQMYKLESDEYKQARRDMWSYDREYQDRMKNKGGSGSKGGGKSQAEIEAEALQKTIEAYKEVRSYIDNINDRTKELEERNEKNVKAIQDYFAAMKDKGVEAIAWNERLANELEENRQKYLTEYSKLMKEIADVEVAEIERIAEANIAKVRNDFEAKKLTEGVEIPADILKQVAEIYDINRQMIEDCIEKINEVINESVQNGLDKESVQYKLLVADREKLEAQLKDIEIERIREVSDATKQGYEVRLAYLDDYYREEMIRMKVHAEEREVEDPMGHGIGLPSQRDLDYINEQFNIEIERLEELRTEYATMSEDMNLAYEERLQAQNNYLQLSNQIEDLRLQHMVDVQLQEQQIIKDKIDIYRDMAGSMADIFGSIADLYEDNIRAQVKNGKMSEEQAEKQFKSVKALRVTEAVIQTLSGSLAAFMSAMNLGWPWNLIVGAASATAVSAAGAAQIAKIANTKFNESGGGVVSNLAAPAMAGNPTADYNANYTQTVTGQDEYDNLSNAIAKGFSQSNMYVSVTDISDVSNRVQVTEKNSTW